MNRFPQLIVWTVLTVLGPAVILIGGAFVAVNVNPRPFAWFVERQFAEGIGVEPITPAIYTELSQNVRVERDIERHAGRFRAVQEIGIYTDSLYYPVEHGTIGHEYQFDFAIPESMESYHRTSDFLAKVTAGE